VIAAPEPDALREASYFVERLSRDRMPLAGLIVNRVHRARAARLSAARSLAAAETLQNGNGARADGEGQDGPHSARYPLAEAALRLHAERMQLGTRERRLAEHNGKATGAKTTRGRVWLLVYAEKHRTRKGAMRREFVLKNDRRFRAALRE